MTPPPTSTRPPRGPAAFTGVVLAGGASRRMGRDKAFVEVGGRPMVLLAADALRSAGADEVLVVGGDATAVRALGLAVRPDRFPGEGPLGGLLTAFAAASHDVVVVLACDLPNVHADGVRALVRWLQEEPALGAVVPVSGARAVAAGTTLSVPSRRREARLEPLHAAYRVPVCATPFGDAFASGERAPHVALEAVPVRTVRLPEERWLDNANTPEDLARLTRGEGPGR